MLYALIGSMTSVGIQTIITGLDIVVVTPRMEDGQEMQYLISTCIPSIADSKDITINYIYGHIDDMFSSADLMNKYKGYFNYIEYYGPTGDIDSITNELNHLKEVMQLINDIYLK